MTLAEAARRDPRLLVLRCVAALEVSLERDTGQSTREGRFHVRIRNRIVFSGSLAAALLRYERARDAQLWRHLAIVRRRAVRPCELCRAPRGRHRERPLRLPGGQRRRGCRAHLPALQLPVPPRDVP